MFMAKTYQHKTLKQLLVLKATGDGMSATGGLFLSAMHVDFASSPANLKEVPCRQIKAIRQQPWIVHVNLCLVAGSSFYIVFPSNFGQAVKLA